MLIMVSLIVDWRKVSGSIVGRFVVRSMFETTSTHVHRVMVGSVLQPAYLKLTVFFYSILNQSTGRGT